MTFRPLTPVDFYPRPPRGGRRAPQALPLEARPFLSTPSARRATQCVVNLIELLEFLSTPSARRATVDEVLPGDTFNVFLSTPSARRATSCGLLSVLPGYISIHALREEGDAPETSPCSIRRYFYPRPPRGGRLINVLQCTVGRKFLSTPSARRATRRKHLPVR